MLTLILIRIDITVARIKDADGRRILDGSSRRRRLNRYLEYLDKDNHNDDPQANLNIPSKKNLPFHDLEGNNQFSKCQGIHFCGFILILICYIYNKY